MQGQLLSHLTDDIGEAPRGSTAGQGELGPGVAVSAGAHVLVTPREPGTRGTASGRAVLNSGSWPQSTVSNSGAERDMHLHWKEHPEINTGGGHVPGGEEERGEGTPQNARLSSSTFFLV